MYRNHIKRIIDIILSLFLLIILSPVFLLTALAVVMSFGFPIIFTQTREGKNKTPFTMYKFKILKNGETQKRKDTMTKATRIMDIYKFNELPQLFNVLKGDMSLVGPRPFIPGDKLPENPKEERYLLKPGMTGLAQINGERKITHSQKLEYDSIYNDKISFLLDLKILMLTPIRIIRANF